MVFNSNIFLFAFLPIVSVLFWLFATKQQRYVLLTLSGYVFYGYWNWRFCFLLLFSSLVSFFAAILVDRAQTKSRARLWVYVSVGVDLTLLGFFKYYNFFAETATAIFPRSLLPHLEVVLPIGISFYTFHTISYIVDVAAGRVKATKDIWEYFTYVCLFSQLVAGPIVRFRQIESDLENIDRSLNEDYVVRGIAFFSIGMIKKVVIADLLARWVNPALGAFESLTFVGAWTAALGYTFQLYYDFCGYSDMAVGLGYLFGLRIPQNFDAPYKALGIRDFWRRWHISLSTWLRDYLYIPLGGNRHGTMRRYINLFVTMLLGGLWHGANWTFVVWGAYHGFLLVLDRIAEPVTEKLPALVFRWLTFILVVAGWVLFRSSDFHMASVWLGKMIGIGAAGTAVVSWIPVAGIIGCFLLANFVPETWDIRFSRRRIYAVAYAVGLFVAFLLMNGNETVFLYYQF